MSERTRTVQKILDIGCGTGFRTSRLWKNKYTHVTGVDLYKENIDIAKNRYKNITFLTMSADKLRFPRNSFDIVVAVEVLEHVDELSKVLREVARVLKPGGEFIVEIPAERSERWLLKIRPTYHEEIHHVRIFDDQLIEKQFKRYGFLLTKRKAANFFHHIELYIIFKTRSKRESQTDIGDWDSGLFSKLSHLFFLYFDSYWVFNSPLRYLPIWLITLPIGLTVNYFGNKFMPKAMYYEFVKKDKKR